MRDTDRQRAKTDRDRERNYEHNSNTKMFNCFGYRLLSIWRKRVKEGTHKGYATVI